MPVLKDLSDVRRDFGEGQSCPASLQTGRKKDAQSHLSRLSRICAFLDETTWVGIACDASSSVWKTVRIEDDEDEGRVGSMNEPLLKMMAVNVMACYNGFT